eukprot:CAMPEP_0185758718 /NCGR_PEP_ID=MMETSP1174-20130828/17398_1 /TAXON_ID=35687 /ORGANISM="Dictyocha speculum, Strain CCMP1381" /LENGTH=208 /DNA_ID=CAMNT_0028438699 /DNA_START=103 /DNA_END=725 /DNA_ORIENTATION=-
MSEMDEEEINELLSRRDDARARKDWATADALREQIRSRGVQVFDKDRCYQFTKSGRRVAFGSGRRSSSSQRPPASYVDNHVAPPQNTYHHIESRIDTGRSGKLLTNEGRHNSNPPRGFGGGEVRRGGLDDLAADRDEMIIKTVLADREEARMRRDYATSDALRDRLIACGVSIYDEDKTYVTACGRRGSFAGGGTAPNNISLFSGDSG